MVVNVLNRKLRRIIWSSKGQFAAMALVIAVGISLYLSLSTAFSNMSKSQQDFYKQYNFADYYFYVVRAPQSVVKQIEMIPGVGRVTGRIQKDAAVIKENGERATARITSFPFPLSEQVNSIKVMQGRPIDENPAGGEEILVDPSYLAANGIQIGQKINIVADNRLTPLQVVGTAVGPEFIYLVKDAANLLPEPQSFGMIMMSQYQCQQIFNLPGQINQVVIQLTPGADQEEVVRQVQTVLSPYGYLTSYPRKDQLSHAILQAKLDNGQRMAGFFAMIFLGVAAGIQLVLLRRLIKVQHGQIGLLKALGYTNQAILVHYVEYALLVSIGGAVMGTGMGLVLSGGIFQLFRQYFNLPTTITNFNLQVLLTGFAMAIGVGIMAGFSGAYPVTRIDPSESMRPPLPSRASTSALEKWQDFWKLWDPLWKMSFRSLSRNRLRLLVTVAGVAASVVLLMITMFYQDAITYMMNEQFDREMRFHYLVTFTEPLKETELVNISRIDGIYQVQPFLEIPVKISYLGQSMQDALSGQVPGNGLKSPYNASGAPMEVPDSGIVLGEVTARKLGATVGDTVLVETALAVGDSHSCNMTVIAINRQMFGSMSYASLQQVNQLMQESGLVSGCMLMVDSGQAGSVEKDLSNMTGISSIVSRQKSKGNLESMLNSAMAMIIIMLIFSFILGIANIYNSVSMNINERKKELGSLSALGFTVPEVKGLLFREIILQAIPGILLGLPLGQRFASWYISAVSTDLITFPYVVRPAGYLWCLAGGAIFVGIGYWFGSRPVGGFDVIELTKNAD